MFVTDMSYSRYKTFKHFLRNICFFPVCVFGPPLLTLYSTDALGDKLSGSDCRSQAPCKNLA